MARQPKPWYRKERKAWFVTISGVRHNLGGDKKEAYRRFHQLMMGPTNVKDISFFDLLDEFLEWTSRHRSRETYLFYQKRVDRFTKERSDIRCSELRPHMIQRWVDSKSWGPTYKAGLVTTLKRCCNWGVKQGYLDRSPLQHLEKPSLAHRDSPVTPKEFSKLMYAIDRKDPFRDLVTFLWETGARPQEALRFEFEHVDHKNKCIQIANPKAKGPKWRVIHLNAVALATVRSQKVTAGPVFKNSRGRPWTTNACSHRFRRLKDNIGRIIAPYDFRHAFATEMLKSDVDPITVAQLMGHTDVRMLMETYQHVAQDPTYIQKQLRKRRRAAGITTRRD